MMTRSDMHNLLVALEFAEDMMGGTWRREAIGGQHYDRQQSQGESFHAHLVFLRLIDRCDFPIGPEAGQGLIRQHILHDGPLGASVQMG